MHTDEPGKTLKKIVRSALVLLIIVLLLSGCDFFSATINELEGDKSTPTKASGVLFFDDFSHSSSGWDREDGEDGQTDYVPGGYLIWVKQPNLDLWANPGLDLGNVSIEADAARVDGPLSNTYGIICRYQDGDNYYFGIVSSDGYYAIGKRVEGENTLLTDEKLQPTDKVADGTSVNHLRLDCIGSTLNFYANGYLLGTAEDDEFTHGDVGVIAGTMGETGVAVTFDNFVIFKPPVE
jgi:hypothetical protein